MLGVRVDRHVRLRRAYLLHIGSPLRFFTNDCSPQATALYSNEREKAAANTNRKYGVTQSRNASHGPGAALRVGRRSATKNMSKATAIAWKISATNAFHQLTASEELPMFARTTQISATTSDDIQAANSLRDEAAMFLRNLT